MIKMYSSIAVKVDPFAEYLEFMFTKKQSKPVAGCKSDDENVLPYDESKLKYLICSILIFNKLMDLCPV
jgi:hypothetical protein